MHSIAQLFRRGYLLALATGLWTVAILTDAQAQITATREWNVDANGVWNTAGNWNPANVPDTHSEEGFLGSIITANRTISWSGTGTRSIGKIRFDNSAASYTLNFSAAGNALFIYNNGTNPAEMRAVEVVAGHHVINIGGNTYGPGLNTGSHTGGNKAYWVAANSSLTFQTTQYFHDHATSSNARRPVIKEGPGVLVVDSGSSHVRVGTTNVTVSEGTLRFTNGYYYPYNGSVQTLSVGSGAVLAGQGEFGAQLRAATASRTFALSGILDPGSGVDGSGPGTMSFFAGRGASSGQTLTTTFDLSGLQEVRLTLGNGSDTVAFRLGAGSVLGGAGNSAGVITGRANGKTTLRISAGQGFGPGTYTVLSWDNGVTLNGLDPQDFEVVLPQGYDYSASLAFNASNTALELTLTPNTPPPPDYVDIVIDNADTSAVLVTGTWTSASYDGQFPPNTLHDGNGGKGQKSVRFTPDIPRAGRYRVYERHPAGSGRPTNVPVDIVHKNGTSRVLVNQQTDGGKWVLLGEYEFNVGTGGYVVIGNAGTSGYVAADAVRFTRVTETPMGERLCPTFSLDGGKVGLIYAKFDDVEYFRPYQPSLLDVYLEDGTKPTLGTPTYHFDAAMRTLHVTYPNCKLEIRYIVGTDQLDYQVTLRNQFDKRMTDARVRLAGIALPEKPSNWKSDGSSGGWLSGVQSLPVRAAKLPGVNHTLAMARTSYTPMYRIDFAGLTVSDTYNYVFQTDFKCFNEMPDTPQPAPLPNRDPLVIEPGGSYTYTVTLKWRKGQWDDVEVFPARVTEYLERFPSILNWPDRRPIGRVFMASTSHRSETNPRGWLNDKNINVFTEAGLQDFRNKLLSRARSITNNVARMNGQAIIIWDIEGQQFNHPVTYLGDPRLVPEVAPEMDRFANEFIDVIRSSGAKIGFCIRPSQVRLTYDGNGTVTGASHTHWGFDPVQKMSDKITYAKQRWGATVFYVDTNTHYYQRRYDRTVVGRTLDAEIFIALRQQHPDVLLIPEFGRTAYYSATAVYGEEDLGNIRVPALAERLYGRNAFQYIVVERTLSDARIAQLTDSVRRGDVLSFDAWWWPSHNDQIKQIYEAANQP